RGRQPRQEGARVVAVVVGVDVQVVDVQQQVAIGFGQHARVNSISLIS
ncbi:hypothetical protein CATMIT_01750, partial [Catenibacterium mitsuokai DSM 15897]